MKLRMNTKTLLVERLCDSTAPPAFVVALKMPKTSKSAERNHTAG